MKRIISTFLVTAVTTLFAAQAMADEAEDAAWKKEPAYGKTIKVGFNGGLCLAPFGIALEKGFYKAEGLDAKIVKMSGGGNAQLDAIGTGKVDVTGDHLTTMLVPILNGVKHIFTTAVQTGCKSLYVLDSSDIKTTKDLLGKSVAIPEGIGTSDNNIALRFFLRDNVDAKKIKFRVVESGAAVLALQKGEIQAVMLDDQFAKSLVGQIKLRSIRSITTDADFSSEPCCMHTINLDFYQKNPITSKKLTIAFIKARKWISENPEEAVDIMLKNHWSSADRETGIEMMKSFNFNVTDEATEKAIRSVVEDYKQFGMIDKKKSTDDIVKKVWAPVDVE